ncbi:zinc finger MYM-type protein 2 [Lingula anatina]|uniref:Zinc finger MYM-type protein 2 n=1 Tax=Lingula anatina TaxID=7574 RepID=A0A1S3H6M8_LINAN|nr:zinc finger MYM-type protein 2 [Lingula anatina]|eukprot:XP_013380784.1 zinc finger MYM-type protein 2 [Lingula anatina]
MLFSDVSDDELVSASQTAEKSHYETEQQFSDISDDELISASQNAEMCYLDAKQQQEQQVFSAEMKEGNGSKRFAIPVTDEEMELRSKASLPKNTLRRNMWALNTWNKWAVARNNTRLHGYQGNDIAINKWNKKKKPLTNLSDEELQYWISKFILEVRKENGTEYPPRTLLSLVMGLQSYIRTESKRGIDLLNSDQFVGLRQVLDSEMKRLSHTGLGCNTKKAQAISLEDESKLWSSKALGDYNPKVLVRTLHYLNGKNFGLRGGQEHRRLRYKSPQITLHEPEGEIAYLKYSEDVSKTCQGGLKHRKLVPKQVTHFANADCPERCHVRIYKKYMELSPKDNRDDSFYLQPLQKWRENVWFSRQPIGVNTLSNFTRETCEKAGLKGFYTNHSLRATTATRLFRRGVDEQLIMTKTGHRSVEGVRSYKRPSEQQEQHISRILDGSDDGPTPPKIRTQTDVSDESVTQTDSSLSRLIDLTNQPVVFQNCNFQFH